MMIMKPLTSYLIGREWMVYGVETDNPPKETQDALIIGIYTVDSYSMKSSRRCGLSEVIFVFFISKPDGCDIIASKYKYIASVYYLSSPLFLVST